MNLFRRAIRFFLALVGFIVGLMVALAAFIAKQMIRPTRQTLWATPADAGMDYEDVEFPARDGLRLSGWFIPSGGAGREPKSTIILVHGWAWNRLGEAGDTLLANISGAMPVDLLRVAHALQRAGYHVLSFDQRNHGQSAEGGPVTFGLQESNDLLGALDYLSQREEVDQEGIGVLGFSMGGNTVLYTLPTTDRIRAAVVVQPVSAALFAERYASDLLGPLGKVVLALSSFIYEQVGHTPLAAIEPVFAAAGAGETPVLYIQGKGDRWGSVSNVAHMAERTPNAVDPLFVDSHDRYGGYSFPVDHPEVVLDFFQKYL